MKQLKNIDHVTKDVRPITNNDLPPKYKSTNAQTNVTGNAYHIGTEKYHTCIGNVHTFEISNGQNNLYSTTA